jgi:NAD(P)-dependent dehydrogenase (short-subunit alcohol dehydrogenase family)
VAASAQAGAAQLGGKRALITGVNSGLGYATMRLLTAHGVHVIGTARSPDKARTACAAVDGHATPLVLELSDYASVVAAAQTVLDDGRPLDILICNAGVMGLPQLELVQGVERQFAVNHLGHFILVNRLLGALRAAPAGRIVVLTSMAMDWAPAEGIQFDNLDGAQGYEPLQAYGQSKLANALFALELARRESAGSCCVNCLHPGVIQTGLMRHLPRARQWQCPQTVAQGAAGIATVAADPRLAGVTGRYFIGARPAPLTGHLADADLAARLWSESLRLTGTYLQ